MYINGKFSSPYGEKVLEHVKSGSMTDSAIYEFSSPYGEKVLEQ